MLNFPVETKNTTKCYVSYGVMGHLDPKQPPVKRKPFISILDYAFIQKIELILPEEVYSIIQDDLHKKVLNPSYSRVILPLEALLEGKFFNEYIKKGNILMLSEPNLGAEKVYSLRAGILKLYLDKESYERAGLVGKPDGVKGKRGTKPRWVVEINLRLPSMLHGKKGFDRIVYAFKNVLKTPVTWLFCDLEDKAVEPNLLEGHFPINATADPRIYAPIKATVPSLKPPRAIDENYYDHVFEDFAIETQEWLSMVSLNSPRINPEDQINAYLSRYIPPGTTTTNCNLVRITWRGLLSSSWAHKAFVEVLLAVPRDGWFSFSVSSFGSGSSREAKNSTIMKPPESVDEYMLWEVIH